MSVNIFRIIYEFIPGVYGHTASDFIEAHLNMAENGTYYITLEAVDTLAQAATDEEERGIVASLRKAVEKHDEFDLIIV